MILDTYLPYLVTPVLILFSILILHYYFHVKDWVNIRNAIILGMASILIVVIANYLAYLKWHSNYQSLKKLIFYVLIVIAFSAEIAKFLVLKLSLYKKKSFLGPTEGIRYGIFIGLGYSLVATVFIGFNVIGTPIDEYTTMFLYSYPFANIVFGICMGFFIGLGKLRTNVLIDSLTGIFVATFFHGLFYFSFITLDKILILFTAVGFVIISLILTGRAISRQRRPD